MQVLHEAVAVRLSSDRLSFFSCLRRASNGSIFSFSRRSVTAVSAAALALLLAVGMCARPGEP